MHPSRLPEPIRLALAAADVPSPSPVLVRLMRLADDDGTTLAELAELVGQDPGLVARVLRVANSPAIGRGRSLSGIADCLAALGTRLIRSIATCLSIQRLFEQQAGERGLDLAPFWAHALLVGELAREVARAGGDVAPDEAYLAGLLHDVGQLILLSALGDGYGQLLASVANEGGLVASEESAMQVSHADIGAWLVDGWGLDGTLADGILFHHAAPEQIPTASPLAQAVWIAHAVCAAEDAAQAAARIEEAWLAAGTLDFAVLRESAEKHVRQLAEGLGLALPVNLFGAPLWPAAPLRAADGDAPARVLAEQLAARAVLQPLQSDLQQLDDAGELLLSLRESARILFQFGDVAFLGLADGALSGAAYPEQLAVFRQARLPLTLEGSMVVGAVLDGTVRCTLDESGVALIDRQFARALGGEALCVVPLGDGAGLRGVLLGSVGAETWQGLRGRRDWLQAFGRVAGRTLAAFAAQQAEAQRVREAAATEFAQRGRRVVHEAGNPLGIIKSYLALLDRRLPEESREDIGVLREELARVTDIIERLSDIPTETAGAEVDAARLLRELLGFYRAPLFEARGLTLELRLPAEPVAVACDADSLKQIALNLAKNAAEALSTVGRLRVTLSGGAIQDGRPGALLEFEDDGPGLPAAALLSLTGSAPATLGKRGNGLSIVHELARRRGLRVGVTSAPGRGTRIGLWLPAARGGEVRA